VAETVIFQSPHPLVALSHRDGEPRAVSWGGFAFEPDERGINWLPVEAVKEMTESHGMVGVPGAVASNPTASSRDLYIAELEASNARLRERIAELEAPADPAAAKARQTTDGGATLPTVFPPDGDHPLGGPQPALQDPPTEAEVAASASSAKVKKG
jgi:hypothetical protein